MTIEWPSHRVLDRIADRRAIMGLKSERALLRQAGLHVDILRDVRRENGSRKRISDQDLAAIAAVLQTTVAYLKGEEDADPDRPICPDDHVSIAEYWLDAIGKTPADDVMRATGGVWTIPARGVGHHHGRLYAIRDGADAVRIVDVADRDAATPGLFFSFVAGEGFGVISVASDASRLSLRTAKPADQILVFGRIVLDIRQT